MNSFDQITNLYGRFANLPWTTRGSLLKVIKLGGVNPSTFSKEDYAAMTFMLRNVLITLPAHLVVTTYLINRQGIRIKPSDGVEHEIGKRIDETRADFLSTLNLSSCDLYVTLECLPSLAQFGRLSVPGFGALLFNAATSKTGRDDFKAKFTNKGAIVAFTQTLQDMAESLELSANRVVSRLGIVMEAETLGLKKTYAFCRFLATYDTRHLEEAPEVPNDNWAKYMFDGEVDTVSINNVPCLYVQGAEDRHVRFGSITGFSNDMVKPGMFALGDESPFEIEDNFVYSQRFHPFTPLALARFFKGKEQEVGRQNLKISDMVKNTMDIENKKYIPKSHIKSLEDLDDASNLPEKWGYTSCHFALFGDPKNFGKRSNRLQARFEQSGCSVVWESSAIRQVYSSMMPTMVDNPIRKLSLNTAQYSAIAPIFKDSQGQSYCKDLDKPALFTFTTRTRKPFYYSHWSGDVGINIGIGPIGSGKTFTKNSMAAHFSKWPCIYRAVDIDPGTEPLAELYGDDGGIFRLDPENRMALNPFALLSDNNHEIYKVRLKSLIVSMLRYNESEESQKLTQEEEASLEEIIARTIKLDSRFNNLTSLVAGMPDTLAMKLSSFVNDGTYATLFSAEQDSIGKVDTLYGVYNLEAIKESPVMLQMAMSEIFFRLRLTVADRKYLSTPKYFDIDEAHHLLKNKSDVDELTTFIRTSRKSLGGMGLWSQNAHEFATIDAWPAIRSAASSFFFMADHTADAAVYKDAFKLDQGQIDAIQALEPKKEALVVQPRINVSQVVQLLVDEEGEALITSQPQERQKRMEYVEKYGFEEGLKRTVDFMRERRASIASNM